MGAISQDAGAADSGAAYVFTYENGNWGQQAKLTADTGASGDQFGFFVGLSGSYAVVGAPQDDDAGSNAGSAYTFVAAGGGSGGGLQTTTIVYSYDPLYRLTNASYTGGITAAYSYIYDAVGNMTAYTETVGTNTTSVTRTFDQANRLLNSVENGSVVTGYGYDGNGNMIFIDPPDGNDAVFYSYNQRNLLTEARATMNQVITAEYLYNGDGNRVQQIEYTGSQPITTTYTNDNLGLSQVLLADDGAAQTANLYGLDLISQDDGAQTHTLLADGLGSVRQEMAGSTLETATTYEPYGNVLAQTGTSNTTYAFTGEQFDGSTGLLYLRARYYNPGLRLFMGRDPWRGSLWRPSTLHGLSYVGNNPVNFVDPAGLCEQYLPDEYCWSLAEQAWRKGLGSFAEMGRLSTRKLEAKLLRHTLGIPNCPLSVSIANCLYNRSTSFSDPTGTYTQSPWNDISNTLDDVDLVLDVLDIANELDTAVPIPGVLGPGVVSLAEMSRNRARNESFWVETGYVVEAVAKDAAVGYLATRAAAICFIGAGESGPFAFATGGFCGSVVIVIGGEVTDRIQITDSLATMNNTSRNRNMCPRLPEWAVTFYSPHPYYAGSCESIQCFPNRPQGPLLDSRP